MYIWLLMMLSTIVRRFNLVPLTCRDRSLLSLMMLLSLQLKRQHMLILGLRMGIECIRLLLLQVLLLRRRWRKLWLMRRIRHR